MDRNSNNALQSAIGKNKVLRFLSKNLILFALIAICIALSLLTDKFLSVKNIMNVLLQSTTMGIVAVGMTYVIITGGIDLSVGSVLALASALGAATLKTGVSFFVGILVMVVVGTAYGLCQGLLISRIKMPAFIVTLAGMSIGRGCTMIIMQGKTIAGLPTSFQVIGNGLIGGFLPIAVLIMLVVYVIGYYVLSYTTFGRGLYSLGGNREATALSGINVKVIETIAYSFCGFTAGLGAMVLTSRLGTAIPTGGEGLELDAIGAVVVGGASLAGGTGTIFGTLIGVLIMGVLNNGMNLMNVNPFYNGVVRGAVILIAVFADTMRARKEQS